MIEWNLEDVPGGLRATHWHDPETRHPAELEADDSGFLRVACQDCAATATIDPATAERLIADRSTDARAEV